jgi:hypothetical protein
MNKNDTKQLAEWCCKHPFVQKKMLNLYEQDENFAIAKAGILIRKIKQCSNILKNNKWDINNYTSLEAMVDSIDLIILNHRVDKIVKENTSTKNRGLVSKIIKARIKSAIESGFDETLLQTTIFNKINRYKTEQSLYDAIDATIKSNLNLDIDGLLNLIKIKQLNVEIIDVNHDEEYLIINVLDYKASKILGSQAWCISQYKEYWTQYINNDSLFKDLPAKLRTELGCDKVKNCQVFIWNFKKKTSNNMHKIGVTFEMNGDISAAHDQSDRYINNINSVLTLSINVDKLVKYLKVFFKGSQINYKEIPDQIENLYKSDFVIVKNIYKLGIKYLFPFMIKKPLEYQNKYWKNEFTSDLKIRIREDIENIGLKKMMGIIDKVVKEKEMIYVIKLSIFEELLDSIQTNEEMTYFKDKFTSALLEMFDVNLEIMLNRKLDNPNIRMDVLFLMHQRNLKIKIRKSLLKENLLIDVLKRGDSPIVLYLSKEMKEIDILGVLLALINKSKSQKMKKNIKLLLSNRSINIQLSSVDNIIKMTNVVSNQELKYLSYITVKNALKLDKVIHILKNVNQNNVVLDYIAHIIDWDNMDIFEKITSQKQYNELLLVLANSQCPEITDKLKSTKNYQLWKKVMK